MKTDILFYRLFQDHPHRVFELTGPEFPADGGYTLHAEEIKDIVFRLDGVLMPAENRPDLPLFFVEPQFQEDRGYYSRVFTSFLLFLHRHKLRRTWRAVLIFPDRATDNGIWEPYQPLLEYSWVRRVYLEDLRGQPGLTPGLRALSLIVEKPAVVMEQARALRADVKVQVAAADRPEWVNLIETILVAKLPKMSRQRILTMLGIVELDLTKTRFYQDVFAEGEQKGRQEGIKVGQNLVLQLLRRRLGIIEPDQEARIQELSVTDLETLADALLDFRTLRGIDGVASAALMVDRSALTGHRWTALLPPVGKAWGRLLQSPVHHCKT